MFTLIAEAEEVVLLLLVEPDLAVRTAGRLWQASKVRGVVKKDLKRKLITLNGETSNPKS